VGASKDDPADPTIDSSVDLITSNVTTRAIFTDDVEESGVNASLEQRVFMVSVPHVLERDNFIIDSSRLRGRGAISGSQSSL
jgi:hypothetical protein